MFSALAAGAGSEEGVRVGWGELVLDVCVEFLEGTATTGTSLSGAREGGRKEELRRFRSSAGWGSGVKRRGGAKGGRCRFIPWLTK